jgi:PII-like signaling protein
VISEGLKLPTDLGERDRGEHGFRADELLDLFAAEGVRLSLLLRGAEGYGLRHHLRTDRLLTLSEDLPLVAVAVDRAERIEALLPRVQALRRKGLITLERARVLTGEVGDTALPPELQEAAKLTVHLGRRERAGGRPAFVAVCELLRRRGLAGATVLLGVDGTIHGRRARARFFGANVEVPMMVVAVGAGAELAAVLPELGRLLARPLLTLERVRICKRDGQRLNTPHALPRTDEHGRALWQQLTVYGSQQVAAPGPPTHEQIVRRLRAEGHAGATVLRGIWGFHGDHEPHGDKLLQLRRHAPVVTTIAGAPDRIAAAFAVVDELTPARGLVTSELVPALVAFDGDTRRGGLRLADHRY